MRSLTRGRTRMAGQIGGKMPGPEADADWLDRLGRAVRRRFGGAARIDDVVVSTAGGSSRTALFDVVEGPVRRRLASRQESYVADTSPYLPCPVQYRLLQLAHAHAVPVPEPLFEYEPGDGLGPGYVTAFVEGETLPNRILRRPELATARRRLVAQYGETLARLHAIDTAHVAFLPTTPDSADPLRAQRDRLDAYGEDHPALELGFRWLERHRPAPPGRRLLHGDFRTGNVIVGPEGLRAVLDWECCHLGSPGEDLGWVCTRSWRFGRPDLPAGGLGSREDLVAAYTAAGGSRIAPDDLRYWEVFGLVRWAVLNVMQAHGHVHGGRRSLVWAACGRNVSTLEYDLLMTLTGRLD